ncbi:MAG TPA: adenylate/guanylate cyclase domain-containing protein [Actinomycetota bacterium]
MASTYRYEAQAAAKAAEVPPPFVSQLVEFGIVVPDEDGGFSGGDVRRIRLMRTLEGAGLPLDGVADVIRASGLPLDFLDQPSYERLGAATEDTFAEVAEEKAVSVELLLSVREAMGSGRPDPHERVLESEVPVIRLIAAQVAEGVRTVAIERWLRVYGDSLRRVAETEGHWWHTEVEQPLLDAGKTPTEMMRLADEGAAQRIAPRMDAAILGLYHGHQDHVWTKNMLDAIEAALAEAGVHSRIEEVPAICFLDITGYTQLTEEQGDEAAAELAETVSGIVRRTSTLHGGKPTKWLGDGVMLYYPEPGRGVVAALEMREELAWAGLPPAHVGMHAGPVLFQEGDYYGRTVNLASRIGDYAGPGQVVVSQAVADAAGSAPVAFAEIGPVELKGITEEVRLYTARREG